MHFFIRFRGQFRRTKPELITSLENTIAEAASAAGGIVESSRKILSASFDDSRIGFWLEMVIFLERVNRILIKSAGELYGQALILGQDIPEISIQKVCRSLSGENSPGSSGIWCSREIRDALELYVSFDHPERTDGTMVHKYQWELPEGYRELKSFVSFNTDLLEFPYRQKIENALARGKGRNTLLLGPPFLGKMDGISHYCDGIMGDIPSLVIRFGAGNLHRVSESEIKFPSCGCGLICFIDAYTPRIRSFFSEALSEEITGTAANEPKTRLDPGKTESCGSSISYVSLLEELDNLHDLLFKERLREEWSSYNIDQSRCFIRSLLTAYNAAIKSKTSGGVLILEDLSLADALTAEVFRGVYLSLPEKPLILAIDSYPEESLRNWSGVFPRILKFTSEDFSAGLKIDLPIDHSRDLWELAYNIFLLGQYFPEYLFPRLLEEGGLNREVYFRALEILEAYGVLIPGDPRPRIPNFSFRAERILPDRKEKVRSAVRNCILSWVLSGRIRPCFNLLRILRELGEGAGDVLILRSLKADILNGTCEGIEESLMQEYFPLLVGAGNAPVLNYIYKTLKALVWGKKEEIHQAFNEPVPPVMLEDGKLCYSGYQAQVETNLAAFHIGSQNIDTASETVRRAMLLNRDLGEDAVPAHRLFSLVNLSRQRIDDALEYISFAVEQAERTGQGDELFLTCYFASSINYLHGNLSRAERLAARAERTASDLGQLGWEMRIRFLRGRLCFETGRYRDALDIFESLFSAEPEGPDDLRASTIKAWIFRTRNFLGRFSPFDDSAFEAGPDAGIFAIEAAYMAADYERAIDWAGRFLSFPETDNNNGFIYTEQPDWESGFSQCEFIFRPGKAQRTKLAWVYRAMAQCALHPVQEAKAEILSGMQRFMRDELLPDTDPNDAFYFYAWYCMLRDIRAAQVDMNTVVSMAYKRLQRRAGRIDDMGTKQAFLNLSRWNSTLCIAAREYKLI